MPQQDSVAGAPNDPETPLPETQKTCLRNAPCMQQGCLTCSMPTNHVRDLSDALDDVTIASTINSTKATTNATTNASINSTTNASTNASTIVPTNASTNASTNFSTNQPTAKLQSPPDHFIVRLTEVFQDAIQDNDIFELEAAMKQYTLAMTLNPEFVIYNCSELRTARNHSMQILNSNTPTTNATASSYATV